ncbi:Signal peptidase I (LepB) (PDB:1B12) (PUBMED:1925027) [Commensalibacter communis]|uniref:signal peptidase I n=1 Tax=Commensalibacter communis TaxID=2972786 RepID=UPI0022FF6692|nr:signal peptidase I [Commensalibacter communis]CAI3947356.1 Signal peptidase I (LepB) (PDB:1B12) (PUBMED:1925027) [Commensalibacter communis]
MNNNLNNDANQNPDGTKQKSTGLKGMMEMVSTVFWAVVIIVVVRCLLFAPFNIPSGSMIPTLLIGDYIFVSKYSYGYSKHSFFFSQPDFKGRIWYTPPQRGDVVVFRSTKPPFDYYVKRLIGLPGDTIQVKNGVLYIDDKPVNRRSDGPYTYQESPNKPEITENLYTEYLPRKDGSIVEHKILQAMINPCGEDLVCNGDINPNYTIPYHVPTDHFFAMGDNRDHSADSRFNDPNTENYLGFVPIENLIGKVQFIFYSYDSKYPVWQFWHWPQEIRWNRLFKTVK